MTSTPEKDDAVLERARRRLCGAVADCPHCRGEHELLAVVVRLRARVEAMEKIVKAAEKACDTMILHDANGDCDCEDAMHLTMPEFNAFHKHIMEKENAELKTIMAGMMQDKDGTP